MSEDPTPMTPKARVAAYCAVVGPGRPLTAKQLRRIKHKLNHAHAPFGEKAKDA